MDEKRTPEARGRNSSMVVVRVVVCGYLIYLGASLIVEQLRGTSGMEPWIAWTAGVAFIVAGIVFGWLAWKRYREETAESPEEPEDPVE